MAPTPEFEPGAEMITPALDRRTRVLVRLAALIALGACTESLRWAVELATSSGADDEAMAAVLAATGSATGSAQLVETAPRLAAALGFDLRAGSRADLLLTEQTRPSGACDGL
jgi:alkylhydroperoxidase/carboxymuconolactone decarboxylase family protein YurZ